MGKAGLREHQAADQLKDIAFPLLLTAVLSIPEKDNTAIELIQFRKH